MANPLIGCLDDRNFTHGKWKEIAPHFSAPEINFILKAVKVKGKNIKKD